MISFVAGRKDRKENVERRKETRGEARDGLGKLLVSVPHFMPLQSCRLTTVLYFSIQQGEI